MEAHIRQLGVLQLDFLVMLLSKHISVHYQGLRPHAEKEVTREDKDMLLGKRNLESRTRWQNPRDGSAE